MILKRNSVLLRQVTVDGSAPCPQTQGGGVMRTFSACARAARALLVGRGWGQPAKRHMAAVPFKYQALFEDASEDPTPYRLLSSDHVKIAKGPDGKDFLQVEPEALTLLSKQAMIDVAHLLRPAHLQQLSSILKDKEASENDKFVALELLKNANVAAGMVLPSCQDTGTGVCIAKRGSHVLTDGDDEAHISKGIYDAYTQTNLRYSQVAPQDMFKESNTKTNLPAQIDLYATKGDTYKFLYMAKGGGSANKTFLFQQTKALLNEKSLMAFVEEKVKTLGTAACPPYHIALVIGGLSADQTLKTVKLASTKYLDQLPTSGNELGRAFRDLEWEERIHQLCRDMGIGAQFGGKYFCHDVRVVRLPRHGASCPVGLGVSCSADRQLKAKINSVLPCLHTESIHTLFGLLCSCAPVLHPFPEAPSAPGFHLRRDL